MKKIFYILTGMIFLISFRFYSALYYPILNSDNAINVLMIHYFSLPHDLYFWGQDRMGSLIPLLGQVFFKMFHFSALSSEAITHYLILLCGFFAFASFIKSTFLKLVFALVWFFPPLRFIDLIQLYSGTEYSLIAISCYLFNQYQKQSVQKNLFHRHFILSSITLLLIASVWVSDMALVTVFVFLFTHLFFFLKSNKITFSKIHCPEFYYTLAGIVAGYLFIHYAKSLSPYRQDYTTFSDFNTIIQAFTVFVTSLSDLFNFTAHEPFTSLYAYLVLLISGILLFQFKNVKPDSEAKKWILFFLLDSVLLFIIIMVSKWTYLNGVPRRYFTSTYVTFAFVILMAIDNMVANKNQLHLLKAIVLSTVFIGGIGTLYNIKYIWPKTLTPKIQVVKEFESLGKIGLIADYWNSYITSCPDPDRIKATPNDQSQVRNNDLVEAVFQQKNIYVIRDMWLKTFPDTLHQFNHILVKHGEEFYLGDCYVCKYDKLK